MALSKPLKHGLFTKTTETERQTHTCPQLGMLKQLKLLTIPHVFVTWKVSWYCFLGDKYIQRTNDFITMKSVNNEDQPSINYINMSL